MAYVTAGKWVGTTGGGKLKRSYFGRGLSIGTKFQAVPDSDSSDDVDEKEEGSKDSKSGRGSRQGSQVFYYLYMCIDGYTEL